MTDDTIDKDEPLRADIRLLGRILGDTLRDQEGLAAFELVENIRQLGVRFHRNDDLDAKRALQELLAGLDHKPTLDVVRAFSYFSHLANIAEDEHHIRRARAHALAGSPPRAGSFDHTLARALAAGVDASAIMAFFAECRIVPVLTAHPTEVQRKSILDCERKIATLLHETDSLRLTPEEMADCEEAIRRAVLTLWQTRLLRHQRLAVMDEVNNALSYYDITFLSQLPRLHNTIEDKVMQAMGSAAPSPSTGSGRTGEIELPAFLRPGSCSKRVDQRTHERIGRATQRRRCIRCAGGQNWLWSS